MRRIKTGRAEVDGEVMVCMSLSDYRLMRAVMAAAERWKNGAFSSGLTDAVNAFNAPAKRQR